MSFLMWLIGLIILSTSSGSASETVRTIPPQSEFDGSHGYFVSLLKLTLKKTDGEYGPAQVVFTEKMQQGRALYELQRGKRIDVYWAGTSIEREHHLFVIRIPLVKGLLGFRMAIIHRDHREAFSRIRSLEDLKPYCVCQGAHWPDSDILEAAGLNVMRNPVYESMFLQVNKGRCHYYLRGIHEGLAEIEAAAKRYPDLVLYRDLIVYYPFPMYFFVSPKRKELFNRLTEGLKQAVADGSFELHMRRHPVTAHLFPIENWIHTPTVKIENPLLPKDTQINDPRYWILPPVEDLGKELR